MNNASGIVNVINTKAWNGKTLYGFALKGQDGFFGLGTTAPTFSKGDSISFSYEDKNGRRNVDPASVTKASPSAPVPSSGPSSGGGWGGMANDTRQKHITWQASRNAAIEAFPHLVAAGAITLPKTGAAKIYEAALAHIQDLTLRFYQETYGVESFPTTKEETDPSFDDVPDVGED